MDEKLKIGADALGFIGSLGTLIVNAISDSRADEATVKAAMEQHVGDFLSYLRDGGEFDRRHATALGKLEAAIAAAKAKSAGATAAKSSTDEDTRP